MPAPDPAPHASPTWPRARLLGDAALIVEFGDSIDDDTHARVMGFDRALCEQRAAGRLPTLIEWVPAFASVTLHFAPGSDAPERQQEALLALAGEAGAETRAGRRWRIPVCFEGEFAPDLAPLARARGLDPAEVIALIAGTEFRVYMLGFQPGFPYLGGLPAACERPRLAVPRPAVPARSLAVAGRMCAIYPWESPGGWHLLGRTPVRPFDLAEPERPALFAPGDRVRWQPVDRPRFDELEARACRGALPRAELIDRPGAA